MKKAMLVRVSFMTRIVVEENATEEEVIEKAKEKFIEKINNELQENIEDVYEDEEVPYDENFDKE
jgi:hypothetical protein